MASECRLYRQDIWLRPLALQEHDLEREHLHDPDSLVELLLVGFFEGGDVSHGSWPSCAPCLQELLTGSFHTGGMS